MARYDVVIVGAGLFGSLSAYKYKSLGRKVLVIDKRSHVGGNLYCESIEGINVHKYGAHIFHTSNKKVWDFVNSFVEFNRFTNSPLANYKNVLYNLPFNMNTFYQLWGTKTPAEAKAEIERQRAEVQIDDPKNLEEQALSLVGKDIYEKLIKGYTEKQWGKSPRDLPAFIIKRIPLRYTFDNNYFSDIYQGIPAGGYNGLISKLLEGCEVLCNADFFKDRTYFEALANQIVYTGRIDEYFTFSEGHLDFRSLYFEQELLDIDNYQGNAVIIIQMLIFLIQGLSSINILNLGCSLRLLLHVNTLSLGKKVQILIILLMMKGIQLCLKNINIWQIVKNMFVLGDV